MSADNPKKSNASERALQSILSCIFALLGFSPKSAHSAFGFAINNRSLRMQRSNEAAIQSDYQTTIGSRSHTGKTALTSARGDRCRFVLEIRSRCNRSGASQLFHRPHLATQSYFAANRQIDAETSR